ncbi:hypothetical protein NAT51_12585 [Flavobacterium amniphilum]|uniref:hypothetical protein n=1 Tax=Flavobacterium amniphilum TaxID=1834035 RepID=UPI002029F93F|nr:hypothetical protein [Flavobacterium amniphilum]MCL9805778.1 hypothetical protein [Flavobacterium amniphilum]MCL9806365.1 hypothetical protein [Flavobacterium amniphilum]
MKPTTAFLFLISTLLFISCKKEIPADNTIKSKENKTALKQKTDTAAEKKSKEEEETMDWIAEELKKIPKNIKPIFGYRFVIDGDFNGDGKKEKLIEHFYSLKEKKETNKFYDNLGDMGQLIALTINKDPMSFLISNNTKIDTMMVSGHGQQIGLSYLKNEGDLNGDGTDEISYVINYADYSNLNSWHIATYKNNQWTEIYSFDIWDWQLPDLPEACNQYGLFGTEDKIIVTENDSLNQALEKQLKEFKGLVRKVKKKRIEITYRTEEADERKKIVKLK